MPGARHGDAAAFICVLEFAFVEKSGHNPGRVGVDFYEG